MICFLILVSLSVIAERSSFQCPVISSSVGLSKISNQLRPNQVGKGWRGLVPLRSKRLDVERLLGQPTDSRGRTKIYQTKSEKVEIWYSSGRCGDGQVWNVPEDAVIRIVVTPETRVLVQDLGLRGYVQVKETHPENWIQYWSPDGGVMVQAIRTDSAEEVLNLTYQPRKTDEGLRCPSGTRRSAERPKSH